MSSKKKETLHIYTRVSTEVQKNEGTSLASQKELGIKKAKELGFEHRIWNEGGASSNYDDFENRPTLLELISEIDAGNVKHLWVYNNDRLSRNDATASMIRAKLKKNAVTLYTQSGQFDLNNPTDEFLKKILDGVAQLDNAQRAERSRIGKLNRVKQGFWQGGDSPFGYQIKDKKLAIHKEESKWVKKIYDWYANGKSIEKIKSELDMAGVKTRRGNKTWTLGSVRKILINTHPAGYYTYTDSKTDETVKCSCPAIVSQSLWNACQEKREKIRVRKGQKNRTKRFYLLRDLMWCGHCGTHMSGRIKPSKHEYLYYCPEKERSWVKSAPKDDQKWNRNKGCPMKRSLNIPDTDRIVWTQTVGVMWNSGFIQESIQKRLKENNPQSESKEENIKLLRNKQKRLEKSLKSTVQSIAKIESEKILGKKDKCLAEEILKNLYAEHDKIKADIEQCSIRIDECQQSFEWMTKLRPVKDKSNHVNVDLDKAVEDKNKRKRTLERLIERIDVFYDKDENEHTLKIRYKIPLEYRADKSDNSDNILSVPVKKNDRKSAGNKGDQHPRSKQQHHGGVASAD